MAQALHVSLTGLRVPINEPNARDQNIKNDDLPTAKKWKPIVHCDIKLGNMVLGIAEENHYPAYKRPILIDFGYGFDDNRYPDRVSKTEAIRTAGCRPPVSLTSKQ
jgi:hypothetical protein